MATAARPEKRRRLTLPPAAAAAAIPHDLLISEVLPRLPVRSLVRFKSVSRTWRAAIEDAAFVRRHLELSRARPPTMLVIPREPDHDDGTGSEGISFHRLLLRKPPGTTDVELMFEKQWPEGVTHSILPTHCDGLVAVATATDQVLVCNPATREFAALPQGSHDIHDGEAAAAALGYDPWRNSYVVARYFYRKYRMSKDVYTGESSLEYDIGHETFTLGGGRCWEPTADPPRAMGPARPACTRGAFYWRTSELRRPVALLRFGLRDRTFDVVPCPPGMDEIGYYDMDYLTELDGRLCYAHAATETAFDVWLADDGGPRPEWSLRCRVDFAGFDFAASIGTDALFPVAAAGDEMLIAADYRNLYRYNARSKDVVQLVDMEVELATEESYGSEMVHHVVPYMESLVSISTRNY